MARKGSFSSAKGTKATVRMNDARMTNRDDRTGGKTAMKGAPSLTRDLGVEHNKTPSASPKNTKYGGGKNIARNTTPNSGKTAGRRANLKD